MIKEIKKILLGSKDDKYQKFSSSLNPNIDNILGVRLPILRKLAKEISKKNWQDFISQNNDEYFELTMLEGMIIGNLNINFEDKLKLIENFIPKINCWAICDSFISSLKEIKENKKETKTFLEKYFNSENEYELRFCFVVLLTYFLDDINYIFEKIKTFNNEQYYAKMAVAWCLSYCFIEDFNKTINFIIKNNIHSFVIQKGITKAIESYQINKEQKEMLKELRKTIKKRG